MKLVAISDTHSKHDNLIIPECDVLIHAGDFSNRGGADETIKFISWFSKQKAKHKILVNGNHDFYGQYFPNVFKDMCSRYEITLLEDSGITIDGINFYGSPFTPTFFNWAFMRDRGRDIKNHWDLIPDSTHVLISHGPAYGILDEVFQINGDSYYPPRLVGCEDLLNRIKELPELRYHFFGHIHSSHGTKVMDNKIFYNVSICDEVYSPSQNITEVII